MSRVVVLLKSPPRDGAEDPYVREFSSAGYRTFFIEVLETGFCNPNRLGDIIHVGQDVYAGVVVTSSRAAEAWTHALKFVDAPGDWSHVPFYVIGEATARSLKVIASSHPNNFSDGLILGVSQSGNSESLAQFVLADLSARCCSGKLLYLTGDKNRDTFNRIMNESGVEVDNLCVYETTASGDLEMNVDNVANDIRELSTSYIWIVFFAPSSSEFALPHLRRHFQLPDATSPGLDAGMRAKLAAIGPTTANYLHHERGLRMDAVPSKPAAERLVQTIRDADHSLPT